MTVIVRAEYALKYLPVIIKGKDIWKYNEIIGYIKISVTRQDVKFRIYKPTKHLYRIDRVSRYVVREIQQMVYIFMQSI